MKLSKGTLSLQLFQHRLKSTLSYSNTPVMDRTIKMWELILDALKKKKKKKFRQPFQRLSESSERKWTCPHKRRVCNIPNKHTLCNNKHLPSIRFKRKNTYAMTLKSIVISAHVTGKLSFHDVKWHFSASVCVERCDKFVLSVRGGFDGLFVMVPESPVSVYSSFAPSSVHVDTHKHKKNPGKSI